MSFLSPKYPRKRVSLDCGQTMTEQSHKNACDVNRIVKRFERDGVRMAGLPGYVDLSGAKFGDFSDGMSYQEAMIAVRSANESFMELPSGIRAKFGNDAGEFLDFVMNPENSDEMIKLGLKKAPVPIEDHKPQSPVVNPDGEQPTSPT